MKCKIDEIAVSLKAISGLLYALAFQAENGAGVDETCLLLLADIVCDIQTLCEKAAVTG